MMAIDTYTRCLKRLGREELARGDDNHDDGTGGSGASGSGSGSSSGVGGSRSGGGSGGNDDVDDGSGHGPLIADCLYQLAQCHLALNNYSQAQVLQLVVR